MVCVDRGPSSSSSPSPVPVSVSSVVVVVRSVDLVVVVDSSSSSSSCLFARRRSSSFRLTYRLARHCATFVGGTCSSTTKVVGRSRCEGGGVIWAGYGWSSRARTGDARPAVTARSPRTKDIRFRQSLASTGRVLVLYRGAIMRIRLWVAKSVSQNGPVLGSATHEAVSPN